MVSMPSGFAGPLWGSELVAGMVLPSHGGVLNDGTLIGLYVGMLDTLFFRTVWEGLGDVPLLECFCHWG